MRITSLEIERFGVWENLYLPKIRRGINVFYGPNEAGKTTLMQFIRSSLYGCSNPERARYIQMALYPRAESPFIQNRLSPTEVIDGGEAKKDQETPENSKWIGGVMTVQDEYGKHRLERRYVRKSVSALYSANSLEAKAGFVVSGGLAAWSGRFFPIPGTGIAESLIISGDDGARLSDHFIQSIVNNVDESTFNNVFAIGLDELQKLGSLDETDAAQMLYRLSVGMDRVSLIQVLHQMVEERNEIFDIKGKSGILDSLIAKRNDLNQKALSAGTNLREYAELRNQQIEAEEAVRLLEEKLAAHSRQKQIYEIAARIAPLWDERIDLRTQLAEYGNVMEVEPEAVREAEAKVAAIGDVRRSLASLGGQYKQVRRTLQNTDYNRSIWKNASLIDMLMTEIPHLKSIDEKIKGVQSDISAVQKELDQEEQRLRGARNGKILLTSTLLNSITDPATGLSAKEVTPADADAVSAKTAVPEVREIDDYRGPARGVALARRRYLKARDLLSETTERVKGLGAELERELTSRGQKSLDEAIAATGALLTQLRRRSEIGKRMNDFDKVKRELTRQNGFLVANQSLPYPVTIAIGVGVALGGLLAVFAFLGKGPFDPSVGIFGVLLAFAVLFYKTTFERKNYAKLEENQRQLAAVMKHYDQVKAEAAVIDQKYPEPGQSIENRIQKAESDQSAFERLLPLDARLKESIHRQKVLEKRFKTAKSALAAAHHRWVAWLKAAGLASTLKPAHIKGMIQRVDFADALRRKIDLKKNVLDVHLRERKGITDRLDYLMAETGTSPLLNASTVEQIEYVHTLLDQVRETRGVRAEHAKKLSSFRKERNKILGKIHKMSIDLDDFLSLFDAKSVDRLKEMAARCKAHQDLVQKFQSVEGKIESGIGGFCGEDEIADVLEDEKTRPNLPALTRALSERILKLTDDQKEKTLQVGRLTEQLSHLAAERDFTGARFESALVSHRIDDIAKIWQSRAVACKMMENIRKAYEKERQPETLKEASRLLCRLTDGLYVKIWTPLGEDTLYVDTNDGQTLDIGSLSRGTREQLFIAIRLALAISFEKHGVNLPLILDDVLVNFDNHRAAAAADVLREFAEAGRQIFLFTCHQHICKTFLKLDRPVFVLPDKTMKVKQFRVILPQSMEQMPDEDEEESNSLPPLPASAGESKPEMISQSGTAEDVEEKSVTEFDKPEQESLGDDPETEELEESEEQDEQDGALDTVRDGVQILSIPETEITEVPSSGSAEGEGTQEAGVMDDDAGKAEDDDSENDDTEEEGWVDVDDFDDDAETLDDDILDDDIGDDDVLDDDVLDDEAEEDGVSDGDAEESDSLDEDFADDDAEEDDDRDIAEMESDSEIEEEEEIEDSADADNSEDSADLNLSDLPQDHAPISAGTDHFSDEGISLSSENPDTADEPAELAEHEEAFDEKDDDLENTAVSADLLPNAPEDEDAEEEVRKPFEFSTWNDFVRTDEKEVSDAEPEAQAEEEEGTSNEFVRRYFTRESKEEFFEGDEDTAD